MGLCAPQGVGVGVWVHHLPVLLCFFVVNFLQNGNSVTETLTCHLRRGLSTTACEHTHTHTHPHLKTSHMHTCTHPHLSFVLLYDLHMSSVPVPMVVGRANSNGNEICSPSLCSDKTAHHNRTTGASTQPHHRTLCHKGSLLRCC